MFITGVIISKIFSYISVLNEINGALFMVLVLIVTLSIAIKNYLDINIIDKNKIAKDIVVFVLTITITMMSILVIRQ
jgi:SNF family Na+-dependent transporter